MTQVSSLKAALRPGLGPQPSGDLSASELASRASSSFVRQLRSLASLATSADPAIRTLLQGDNDTLPAGDQRLCQTNGAAPPKCSSRVTSRARGGGFSCPLSRQGRPPVAVPSAPRGTRRLLLFSSRWRAARPGVRRGSVLVPARR